MGGNERPAEDTEVDTILMDMIPIGLAKQDGGRSLEIQWSDGWTQQLTARQLRDGCPCATCREKKAADRKKASSGVRLLQIVSDAELQPLTVVQMRPTGNYAYSIHFSDSHGSGVYTLEYLRALTRGDDKSDDARDKTNSSSSN
jgi:DUF971 family protein